jgi:ABC-2 type transport system ATP-binding protein
MGLLEQNTLAKADETSERFPAVEACGLVKEYPDVGRVLDEVTFNVASGTIFALLGPNGAGKSTMVRILTTLSSPGGGVARVGGFDVATEPGLVRRQIGCVFQKSGADGELTARENLVLQGRLCGLDRKDSSRRSQVLLDKFGISAAADRRVETFSGGMVRKLDIALGMIHGPRILFLDEPTVGLDPESRADVWCEISRLQHEAHLTVFLTTHYLEEAEQLATRLAILESGHLVAEGTADELKREILSDTVEFTFADRVTRFECLRLREIQSVAEPVVVDDFAVRFRVRNGANAAPELIDYLQGIGLKVASIKISRPSLDDVYRHHAGRPAVEKRNGQ